ncbi:MAG: TonB-dependent receptor [Flavobacteriales bacterium]|nr:TonB-dependent receptor [Flavobacteriales bacterium]
MAFKAKLTYLLLFFSQIMIAQSLIQGVVYDKSSKETLIGANVIIPSSGQGSMTDLDGYFQMLVQSFPVTIEVSFIGFEKKSMVIENDEPVKIYLGEDKLLLSEVVVVDSRLTEKQKQSPITVETMDVIAIKETPTASFYEGLGALKGVDVTSASLGFKIINTRGFNSTSPVRSLQIIDGVDNQSPGLNFSLGNFLGSSELDLKKVDIIVGANSALYGPNAFNGVISMETKDPFQFKGLSAQYKGGSRNLHEVAVRFADVIKNKAGDDKLGYKINFYKMTADDWVADNYDQTYDTPSPASNFGGYDAVNIYGDEEYSTWNSLSLAPGLGTYHRQGYKESDLVDYNTQNQKLNAAFHYKPTVESEIIYSTNYGTGTTVYQGDNRYSLKNLNFYQNRLEYKVKDKFFIRLYETHEDAGDSYDAVATAVALQNMQMDKKRFSEEYIGYWRKTILPQIYDIPGWEDAPKYGSPDYQNTHKEWKDNMNKLIEENEVLFEEFHDQTQTHVNDVVGNLGYSFLEPGTADFEEAFNKITSETRYDEYGDYLGGTKFYDESQLYHAQSEYKFNWGQNRFTIGANARMYKPDSRGSIFNDGYVTDYNERYLYDDNGNPIMGLDTTIVNVSTNPFLPVFETVIDSAQVSVTDTTVSKITITNKEFGVYAGVDRDFLSETLKLSATLRMDKNENFDYLVSPAISMVYLPSEKDVLRVSLSSAIRNPTLADQYLNYDAGPAILIGNLNGFGYDQYFVNADSLEQYFINDTRNPDALIGGFMEVDPIQPEKVKTVELGYRTTLFDQLYIDASAYYSTYTDFIGYQTGASFAFGGTRIATDEDVSTGWASEVGDTIDEYMNLIMPSIQGYRVAANAKNKVNTKGFTIGLNYFLNQYITVNGNYSWSKLIKTDDDDPIIPAYNTPEHKYNVGITGRGINLFSFSPDWGFGVNYKWIEGFIYEGSPQFTGPVPTYSQLDAQISKEIKQINATLKLGASNLLNNKTYQVYGGPRVGRMMYSSLQFDF